MTETLQAGVIGVGTMGQHHVRVYDELQGVDLIGISDADTQRATEMANQYSTSVYDTADLIDKADLVSIAVPTSYHYELATRCIDAGTNLLVEKPFVNDVDSGKELTEAANKAGVTLQVGHIERFNPVTSTLQDIIPSLDVISVTAKRLGPQPDRTIEDSVVTDLMIHDLDVVQSLFDSEIANIVASGAVDGRYATATLELDQGIICSLTASRVTQKKVRMLQITAEDCYITVDYLDQSVEIHRQSAPEYVADDGEMRYRHEGIIERPAVGNGEPLKRELQAFVSAVRDQTDPVVDGYDGIKAVELAQKVNKRAFGDKNKRVFASN